MQATTFRTHSMCVEFMTTNMLTISVAILDSDTKKTKPICPNPLNNIAFRSGRLQQTDEN